MARDRKRAKDRRRRQDGAQPPRAPREPRLDELVEDPELEGTTPGSHKDAGLEDVVDPIAADGTTPAPDPLKHGSSWVDEAKLAEAGATLPQEDGAQAGASPDDVDDYDDQAAAAPDEDWGENLPDEDRAPDRADEYQPPVTAGRRGRPAAVAATAASGSAAAADDAPLERRDGKSRARFVTFLGHCADELKRVQWPTRNQTFQGTAVTLGFVVVAGGYLGLMDAVWKPIVEAIL